MCSYPGVWVMTRYGYLNNPISRSLSQLSIGSWSIFFTFSQSVPIPKTPTYWSFRLCFLSTAR